MTMGTEINTHNLVIEFGKHKGERWTRIPLSYLKWLANEGNETAKAELERRGSVPDLGNLEISGHAIDRASLRLRKTWHSERGEDEGLHAWLHRRAKDADDGVSERVTKDGIKFVFQRGELYATLKSVMPEK